MTLDPLPGDLIGREIAATSINEQIRRLRYQYRHTRLSHYKVRRHLLARIRQLESRLKALYSDTLTADPAHTASLYKPSVAYNKAGFKVLLELSLDGTYYANPAPVVPANATVYVRATIDEAHHGDAGIPRTHQMFRLRWKIGKNYTALDTIPRTGHDVYAVCWPLVITRKFRAPAMGTKRNFLLDVDAYEMVP